MSQQKGSQIMWGSMPVILKREWRDRRSSVKEWEFKIDEVCYYLTTILPHNAGPSAQWVASEIRQGSAEGDVVWHFRTDPRGRGANAFCNNDNGRPVVEFIRETTIKGSVKRVSLKVSLQQILGLD